MQNPSHSIVFNKTQVQEAVNRLAGEIAVWLQRTGTQGLNLLCVLEGAKPFTRDLGAALQKIGPGLELRSHEVRIKGTDGTHLLKDRQFQTPFPTAQTVGHYPVLIADDLTDSGLTLKLLKQELEKIAAGPVKTAVLIRKFGEASGPVDFIGFELGLDLKELASKGLKDYWLYGYGMDLDGKQRDLDHIGWVEIR